MKKLLASVILAASFVTASFAQTYPYTNPSYMPNIRPATFTVVSGVANATVTLNNIGTTTLQLAGTCTSLTGRLEASNNGSNWVTLNLYENGVALAASAVTSISGVTGMWSANTGGLNLVRMNNTGVSGTACAGTIAGSSTAFSLPH